MPLKELDRKSWNLLGRPEAHHKKELRHVYDKIEKEADIKAWLSRVASLGCINQGQKIERYGSIVSCRLFHK